MKGVLLAGGQGTRLRPLTEIANKHLLPIYDRPMILYPIETLKALGLTDILIVSGGEHIGTFAEFLGDGSRFDVRLTYKVQEEAGGIAQALGLAESFACGESVVVILGDNIFDNRMIAEKKDLFTADSDTAKVCIKEIEDPERFGVPEFDAEGALVQIIEKPKNPPSSFAVTGLYVYPNDVFECIKTLKPSERGELEITDVNNYFIKDARLESVAIDGFWSDAGTFDSLIRSSLWAQTNKSND